MNIKTLTFITVLTLRAIICLSQSSTYSPYSYFGIGEFEVSDYSLTSGLGGVSQGIKSEYFINFLNPASYSGIDSLDFIFDLAFNSYISKFQSNQEEYQVVNGNLKKIALGFRLNPRWAISLGLVPFTRVGYKINTQGETQGATNDFDIFCQGEGGFNRIFFGNSFKLSQRVSIGINTSMFIGSLKKTEEYTSDYFSGYWKKTTKYSLKPNLYFDFGFQFKDSINSKWMYNFGMTGGINTKLLMKEDITKESDTSTVVATISSNDFNFWIPAYGSVGFSVYSGKWLIAADYRIQYWNNVKNRNDDSFLTNNHRFALGTQYCPNKRLGSKTYRKIKYQIGAHYDLSYLKLNSQQINIYGLNMGIIIPLRDQFSSFGLSFEIGKKGTMQNGLFKENYYQLNLSINMNDLWFIKPKIE